MPKNLFDLTYDRFEAFQAPDTAARTYQYSPDGRLFALAVSSTKRLWISVTYPTVSSVRIHIQEPAIPYVVELRLSPLGTYLSTRERHVKLGDGDQHKNLYVFSVSTGEERISFSQKSQDVWDVHYTISESHAIRLLGSDSGFQSNPGSWGARHH